MVFIELLKFRVKIALKSPSNTHSKHEQAFRTKAKTKQKPN